VLQRASRFQVAMAHEHGSGAAMYARRDGVLRRRPRVTTEAGKGRRGFAKLESMSGFRGRGKIGEGSLIVTKETVKIREAILEIGGSVG
jgi:hypothetical protein